MSDQTKVPHICGLYHLYIGAQKSVMWIYFRFLNVTDVEFSEFTPHVEFSEFCPHVEIILFFPHDISGEI